MRDNVAIAESILHGLRQRGVPPLPVVLAASVIPPWGRLRKARNALLTIADVIGQRRICRGGPLAVRIAPIAVCNYRCLFCEIHKDLRLYPKRPRTPLTLADLENCLGFLAGACRISFYGGTAEPLLNREFGAIVDRLKRRWAPTLMVNTNGSVLNRELADIMVRRGFDDILLSYHAGTPASYARLMAGGSMARVDANFLYLKERKQRAGRQRPAVDLNFALQRENAGEYREILDKARQLGARRVIVSRYYGGRNRLQDREVSFEYAPDEGNRILDAIHAYAKTVGIDVFPETPDYWRADRPPAAWDPADLNDSPCFAPWTSLQVDADPEREGCRFFAVCNRLMLFRVRTGVTSFKTGNAFRTLWNHPVLQYLRSTVNARQPNPICRFCKNRTRASIRNVDPDGYARLRDQAVRSFFEEARKAMPFDESDAIEVLRENPADDNRLETRSGDVPAADPPPL